MTGPVLPFRRIDGKNDAPRVYKLGPPLVPKPVELLSVTSILSALPKPALKAWGEGLVADAAVEIFNSEIATSMDADELREWLKDAPYRKMTRAGKRGTGIHEIAEMVLTGRGDPGNSPWGQMVAEWQAEWVGELLAVEQCIVNLADGWGGTADLIYANKQGKVILGDWKSSKSVYPDQALQLGAYTRGDRWIVDTDSMTPSFVDPIEIEAVEILHITDKGITTFEPDAPLDRLYGHGKHCGVRTRSACRASSARRTRRSTSTSCTCGPGVCTPKARSRRSRRCCACAGRRRCRR